MIDPPSVERINGYYVIATKQVGDRWFWLCEGSGYQPYVTWVSSTEEPQHTVWGHYHSNFIAALQDFQERIRNTWQEPS